MSENSIRKFANVNISISHLNIHTLRFNYSCMYILPKDINKDIADVIPYGFEVDIIKDCTSLRNDIADVFNVIDRNSQNYEQTIEKVNYCFEFISFP